MASDHWADEQGHTTIFDGIRTPLPEVVHPGQDADITIAVVAPPDAGRHQLLVDLVHEQTTWFSAHGCAIALVSVDVA
jgi:hypothetical protein